MEIVGFVIKASIEFKMIFSLIITTLTMFQMIISLITTTTMFQMIFSLIIITSTICTHQWTTNDDTNTQALSTLSLLQVKEER